MRFLVLLDRRIENVKRKIVRMILYSCSVLFSFLKTAQSTKKGKDIITMTYWIKQETQEHWERYEATEKPSTCGHKHQTEEAAKKCKKIAWRILTHVVKVSG